MLNLYILSESFTNGLYDYLLNAIFILSIICGISVIVSKNPIVSVLFLIGLFLNIALYLIILGISFIGLSYLLVYVGAVSILFLFILMLINVRVSELTADTSNSIPLAIIIGVTFNIVLYRLLPHNINLIGGNKSLFTNQYISLEDLFQSQFDNLFFVTYNVWDGILAETSHITSIGNIIYTSYPIWLVLTSLILLLSMVGAIIITIKQ